jgi:hypothetical protein
MGEEIERTPRRFSSFVLIALVVGLVFSLIVLSQAYYTFQSEDPTVQAQTGFFLLIGFIGLVLSTYMLFQIRRRIQGFTLKTPPITTTIVCAKCGLKNVRNFERGDYILKELGPCTKCEGTMIISAIYREVKQKGKEEKIFT